MKAMKPQPPTAELAKTLANPAFLAKWLESTSHSPTVGDRYVHYDKLRLLPPPPGFTKDEWWASLKLARRSLSRPLPLLDTRGVPFHIAMPDPLLRYLSEADRDLGGRVPLPDPLVNPGMRDRYRVSASIEEAITSSQLEGATTTRKVAAAMLRSGRKPATDSERMIFNNYLAMGLLRESRGQPLTPDLVLRIHHQVTDGTLDDPADAGRLRTNDEVAVYAIDTDEKVHQPPSWKELPDRLQALCDFANEKTPDYYLHAIARAVLLHFWLAYDHPFADGNGRTARALFYWSMAKSGYWLAEYLSISHILRKAPAQYARAYLYSETDDNDATYFVLYQLGVFARAIQALHEYLGRKMEAIAQTQALLRQSHSFNHRQLALLGHALRNPDAQYSPTAHANSHQVTRQTARTDLKELAAHKLLSPLSSGHGFRYAVPQDLEERLERFGKRRGTGPATR